MRVSPIPILSIFRLAASRGAGCSAACCPASWLFSSWDRADCPAGAHLWLDAAVRVCGFTLPVEEQLRRIGKPSWVDRGSAWRLSTLVTFFLGSSILIADLSAPLLGMACLL